jgi:anthranilate phosphoribosyltransferase
MLKTWTEQILKGHALSRKEAEQALGALLEPSSSDEDRASFLEAMADKGETVDEICGFVDGMMFRCEKVVLPSGGVDLCGTGGSGLERFNISTTVAYLLASMDIGVVKHGNKGSKKNNGSFDLLEKLGVDLTLSPEEQAKRYNAAHLCFLFARVHHPGVKAVGPARAQLGQRTIFNLVGPLCNPASVQHQVLGVSDPKLGPIMAEALLKLGREKAAVVWGEPGIDEFSVSGDSRVWWVVNGEVREETVQLSDFGLSPVPYEKLPKGDCDVNAEIFTKICEGDEQDGLADMVALNAAAALVVTNRVGSLKEGFALSREKLRSGAVKAFFENSLS